MRAVLAGIGGYGAGYLAALLDRGASHGIALAAVADPFVGARPDGSVDSATSSPAPDRCPRYGELALRSIPHFPDLAECLREAHADLVIVSTPIHLHAPHTRLALSHGADVLCEKPAAATIQDVRSMQEAAAQAGRFVAIGYQWSYSPAVQRLAADVRKGRFGQPVRLKTLACWPRARSYYQRARWAGRLRTNDGSWVLDSPAHNATAHYLHNMLYVLGQQPGLSRQPIEVTAELYRANPIESFDTAAIRCVTAGEVELLFFTTHAASEQLGPIACYQFEEAVVWLDAWSGASRRFVARFRDGSLEDYGSPDDDDRRKLWEAADAVRSRGSLACGLEAAAAEVLCVNGAHDSCPAIAELPHALVSEVPGRKAGERLVAVAGLADLFVQCFERACLPSELGGVEWTQPGKTVDLRDYRFFPGGRESPSRSAGERR